MKAKTKEWWLAFLAGFLATVLGIVFTFGTSELLDRRERKADRRTAALMVMGSIESFARQVDQRADEMARLDTVMSWVLGIPKEQLDLVPQEQLSAAVLGVTISPLSHDTSAESIFKSNTDTWRNLGNFQFINNVGNCFAMINQTESSWNEWVENNTQLFFNAFREASGKSSNPIAYVLKGDEIRAGLLGIHNSRGWLRYVASSCRHQNRINMALIGIPEEEVKRFSESHNVDIDEPVPGMNDFNTPLIPLDSLVTMRSFNDAIHQVQ